MSDVHSLVSMTFDESKGTELGVECASCKVATSHTVVTSVESVHSVGDELGRVLNEHQIIQCLGCKSVSYRNVWGIAGPEDTHPLVTHESLFPPRKDRTKRTRMPNIQHVSGRVQTIYWETMHALNGEQPILAGIGIRGVLEAICREKRAAGRNLEKRIDSLVTKGFLSPRDATTLHKLRFLGNRAAHELKRPPREQLLAAMDIVEHLLRTVYVIPQLGRSLRGRS